MLLRALVLALLVNGVDAHSWLDCVDYDCPGAGPNSGPQPPGSCTCKGFARNWANVMAGAPFAADRGRDNRPGAAANAGGLTCDSGKEPNPGPGTTIPQGLYSTQYPAATLAAGQTVRWRWPAKNHANTPAAGTVEVYISNTPNSGDDFSASTPIAGQMSYSSDNGDCLGLDQSTDTADCQGTWTVPANLAPGRYTILWFWEFNPGEFYNSCADVMITAAVDGGGGGGGGDGGGIGIAPSPPLLTTTRVSFPVEGSVSDISDADKAAISTALAAAAQVVPEYVDVAATPLSFAQNAGDKYYASAFATMSSDGFSVLVSQILIVADITHAANLAGATDAEIAETRLKMALSSAAAASTLLSAAQVTVLETPVVTTLAEPIPNPGGGTVVVAAESSNAGVIAAVVCLLVVVLVGGFFYFRNQKRSPPQVSDHSPALYEVDEAGKQEGPPPPPPEVTELPPGWSEVLDPTSRRMYYVHAKTQETTWTRPTFESV